MANIKLKKGFDLILNGQLTSDAITPANTSPTYAIVPDDFQGIIPRMDVKEGESVQAGAIIYHDKNHEQIKVTAPVAGVVKEVRRGERRKIEAIIIEPDGSGGQVTHDNKKDVKELLLESGLWVMMRQRPYDVVPAPDVTPRDIVVTCFDSAPLAPSLMQVLADDVRYVAPGVEALKGLTRGNVYLCFRPDEEMDVLNAEVVTVQGPHPAGNAGVQLANIKPVNKGEVVWTLDVLTLARIGKLMKTGVVDFNTVVAVTGEGVSTPRLLKANMGCSIQSLLQDDVQGMRIISGNVLTGIKVNDDEWLRAPYRHVTVIPEVAKRDEFMGWASLSPKRYSIYRLFTSWLTAGKKPASFDARIKGGERAIVRLDEYDRMLPMDIYAEFLIKAIIAGDIEKMEQLGIYEVAPEDFALAEYADTSKLELQRIVRQGLDKLRAEME
ncbi:MAG: Na(+)-translocating NADH-quinone reductase subunit A [Muribaculaceae bacterium]|nr:Na(+)-translocating NADH-quinone reductase subunit A [Muribaculaceae bacterium]